MKSKENIIKFMSIAILTILLVLSITVLVNGWMKGHFNSVESLRAYISSFGIWAPFILMLIQVIQVILPVLPGFTGCIVGAVLFGSSSGFWINYIGISAGSIIAYWLAKHYGIQLVNKMISMDKYKSYIEKINKSKSYTTILFLSILLPLAPDDFLCYFSGLINMSSKKFITIIILGKPWCILFYSIFFAYFI